MELKVLWLFDNLMDLYGDRGNIQVLKERCARRGIECTVDTYRLGDDKKCSDYDIVFMGGGADHEQNLLYEDLLGLKDDIAYSFEKGTQYLLICGGYQLFGQYYLDQDGIRLDGLGLYDYYTEATTDRNNRCIGNIAVEVTIDGETFKAVGFENHGGQTRNVDTPLGRTLSGHGNTADSGYEGFVTDNVIGTYMHGPLLPKNPRIADILIKRALRRKYGTGELAPLDDTLENKARNVMLKRLGVQPEG
ncbi:MAG: glutamine amidotransferase [Solobacterium sp.]|nr:glutamine amidotransferase [Solobacterium sp.]